MHASANNRTITVSLKPKTEARLRAIAAVRGVPMDEYLTNALDQVADDAIDAPEVVEGPSAGHRPFDPDQWDSIMNALSEGAGTIPILSNEDLTRAAIYGDHD